MAPITRARRARDAASADKLPADVLFLVLQLLPPKDICRFRTVCRSWRSIASGQAFIRAHADRHKHEPLFVAKFQDGSKAYVYVVDLSSNVVKRIAVADGGDRVLRARLNLVCLCLSTRWMGTCRVLDPATGRVQTLPPAPPEYFYERGVSFGLVASTGEYKLLRLRVQFGTIGESFLQVEVLTINGGTDHWRRRRGPDHEFRFVDMRGGAVVGGVVYFLTCNDKIRERHILSFDLGAEEWGRDLPGPSAIGKTSAQVVLQSQLSLADLKGSLVLAHHRRYPWIMDLWFVEDFESGLWVKEYSIRIRSSMALAECRLIPLLALDDGRLVIHFERTGLLFICDPQTNTFRQVNIRHLDSIAVYTGSLLSLQEGDMV